MPSFNKVILMGNMVADPELRQTPSGLSVCTFSIAVQRRFSRAQENEKTTDFFTVNAWDKNAEFVCRYFKKGNPVLVCGSLQTRNWVDQQGQKRYATEVRADEITFASSASSNNSSASESGNTYTPGAYSAPTFNNAQGASFEEIPDDGSLPF
jgi:single-strand DNA-binding protein